MCFLYASMSEDHSRVPKLAVMGVMVQLKYIGSQVIHLSTRRYLYITVNEMYFPENALSTKSFIFFKEIWTVSQLLDTSFYYVIFVPLAFSFWTSIVYCYLDSTQDVLIWLIMWDILWWPWVCLQITVFTWNWGFLMPCQAPKLPWTSKRRIRKQFQ